MKNIIFEKYHGNGNDFVIIDSRNNNIYDEFLFNNLFKVKDLCDRNFGIGADGIIFLINPKGSNDAKMKIYNSDGSEAEMCGNGIRCLIEYLKNESINEKDTFKIETKAGLKLAKYKKNMISVSMGLPILKPEFIPTTINTYSKGIPYSTFNEDCFSNIGYAVGMGNPHLIFFLDDILKINTDNIGSVFEKNNLFPEKTNVHFCQILDKNNINVKVWERGAGSTLACGTGACAIHVAAFKLGLCNYQTNINLPGGPLLIEWKDDNKEIIMTGYAKCVYKGCYIVN